MILQFLTYASRARCVRECKAKSLSATQRYPSPEILNRFKQRDPYSFLHFSYYQVREEGGREGGREREGGGGREGGRETTKVEESEGREREGLKHIRGEKVYDSPLSLYIAG